MKLKPLTAAIRVTLILGLFAICHLLFEPEAAAQQKVRDTSVDDVVVTHLTNRFSVKVTPHSAYEITYHNASGGNIYLHFFDTNGVPANGAIPNLYIPVLVPTDSQASVPFSNGLPLTQGLVVCASSSRHALTLGSTNGPWTALIYGRAP
jgi:hypothetical protein